MRTIISVIFACFMLLAAPTVRAELVGSWELNGSLDNALPGGLPLSIVGDPTTDFVLDTINGQPTQALSFSAFSPTQWLEMPNPIGPNGPATKAGEEPVYTNAWTVVMDVKFPTIDGLAALIETDSTSTNAELFILDDGQGIGGSVEFGGVVQQNRWHRLAMTVTPEPNRGGNVNLLMKQYIDGSHVSTFRFTSGKDGWYSLKSSALLFTDNDRETAAGLIGSLALYDEPLSEADMRALGGPKAGVVVLPSADLTRNGFVDFDDLSVLLANWNKSDITTFGGNLVDAMNTSVDFDDLAVLLTEWTGPAPVLAPEAALAAAVPEPSTLMLAAMALCGICCYRRRRNE